MSFSSFTSLARFFPPPRFLTMPAVGVDISDRSVKTLSFRDTATGKVVAAHSETIIEEGVVENGEIRDEDALVGTLREMKAAHQTNRARVALPEEQAFLFETETVRAESEADMRAAIEFQIEGQVPVPAEELVFDYDIIQELSEERLSISVTAFRREFVESYLRACTRAGLSVQSLELEAQAIARAVIPQNETKNVFLVDFGRARSGVAITRRGIPVLTTTIDVGGGMLSSAIMKHFDVDEKEAERIKNEQGFTRAKGSEGLYESLMNTISALKDELSRHITFWQSRDGEEGVRQTIDQIVLVGGNANLKGLPEYLTATLQIPTVRANVWQNALSFDDTIPPIDRPHSLGYATAIGLALSRE